MTPSREFAIFAKKSFLFFLLLLPLSLSLSAQTISPLMLIITNSRALYIFSYVGYFILRRNAI